VEALGYAFPLFLLPSSLFLPGSSLVMRILAVDPGREKCGVVAADDATILDRAIVPTGSFGRLARDWGARYAIRQAVLGDRTGSDVVAGILTAELPGVPITIVREADTTLLARRRYFVVHPPRGWRRLLPLSMQVPPEPYDDYAAQVILERFLEGMR